MIKLTARDELTKRRMLSKQWTFHYVLSVVPRRTYRRKGTLETRQQNLRRTINASAPNSSAPSVSSTQRCPFLPLRSSEMRFLLLGASSYAAMTACCCCGCCCCCTFHSECRPEGLWRDEYTFRDAHLAVTAPLLRRSPPNPS